MKSKQESEVLSGDILFEPDVTDDWRRQFLFSGGMIINTARASTRALAEHASAMIVDALGDDPQYAQQRMSVPSFVEKIGPLKSRFTNDEETKRLVKDVIVDFGCDAKSTLYDVPRLRIVTSDGFLSSGLGYAYKAHRDTWYASPHCQVNWWMGVFDIVPEGSMAFYPDCWSKVVPNTSSDFDYAEWCAVGRKQAASQIDRDLRNHPVPTVGLLSEVKIRAGMPAGSVLLFSAAHLHETVANESGRTRFSLDFRTINREDIVNGHGAINQDCEARGTTISDFLPVGDGEPLSVDCLASSGAASE